MEKFIQIAPHSLALVLSQVCGDEDDDDDEDEEDSPSSPAVLSVQLQHHTGYEVFANFKAVNMQHFWNKALTHALSEIFFLGWIDEHVLLIQGKEVHLQVLRNGWTRRTLKPPQGFDIECIGRWGLVLDRIKMEVNVASPLLGILLRFHCPLG
ncbi:storkhead-box protein 1-like isoform X2 [Xiphias gladius]|uniref:storkhead-box protein 1-like isoform X2 n=1 Tax=Xiphias gladius TaxID=8245 RepID=UPI001A97E803|nr:storkhead-box protein 1-like isoform X2 [Xiphias gladius]